MSKRTADATDATDGIDDTAVKRSCPEHEDDSNETLPYLIMHADHGCNDHALYFVPADQVTPQQRKLLEWWRQCCDDEAVIYHHPKKRPDPVDDDNDDGELDSAEKYDAAECILSYVNTSSFPSWTPKYALSPKQLLLHGLPRCHLLTLILQENVNE